MNAQTAIDKLNEICVEKMHPCPKETPKGQYNEWLVPTALITEHFEPHADGTRLHRLTKLGNELFKAGYLVTDNGYTANEIPCTLIVHKDYA